MAGKVTVVQTGKVKEIDVKAGMTVKQALASAGVSTGKGVEIRLNGKPCKDLDTKVKADDQVMAVGEIAGG